MGGSTNILDPLGLAQGSKILDPLGLVQDPDVPAPPGVEDMPARPTEVDPEVIAARKRARKQAALRKGRSSTILTRPMGLTSLINQ